MWSPPWHLYILLLANLLIFYLIYFLAFDLAFYLADFLAFYLAYLLADVLAYLLADVLVYLLAYLLAYERSAKPQLKNKNSGQSYRFWDFTISFYSISWLPHAHPLANCVRKAFLHLHFSVWSIFDCPALSFVALQLYGLVWYMSMQLQITVVPNKFESNCWKKSGWALTATCSIPFNHSPAWKAMERRKYA